MKSFNIHTLLFVPAILFMVACEKDIAQYENDPRVYFFERNADVTQSRISSRSFSFLLQPADVVKDTFLIRVKIMGNTAATDRVVRGETVKEGTTAQEGLHYDFIDGIIPADSTTGYLPVILYRTPDLATAAVKLQLTIADSKDFKPGVTEDAQFTLEWSDNVIKPENWDALIGLRTFFGDYSQVKFRFIIQVTGIDNFPLQQSPRVPPQPGEFTAAAMLDVASQVKAALLEYNTNNPPLTDEDGKLVTFP